MESIKNGRVFKIKYLGATNTKGSRIKIIDCRFKKSKTLSRSYKHISGLYDAVDYLTNKGINILYQGELNYNENILISDDFEIMI